MLQKKLYVLYGLLCLVMLTGCGPKRVSPDSFQTIGLEFTLIHGLSSPNPEIILTNVPSGTAFLTVTMRDYDRPNFDHGGGTIAYDGSNRVPQGSLSRYRGPQPPSGEVHSYEITVQALNADQSLLLGEGKLVKRFP